MSHQYAPSPLSTKEQRDRLLRQPLRREVLQKKANNNPDVTSAAASRRSTRVSSPPNSNFMTSSPVTRKSDEEDLDETSPGVSIIEKKRQQQLQQQQQQQQITNELILASDEDDEEASDDSQQPSAKVRKIPNKSRRSSYESTTTPVLASTSRSRSSKSARKFLLDESSVASISGSSSTFTGKFWLGFFSCLALVFALWMSVFFVENLERNAKYSQQEAPFQLGPKALNQSIEGIKRLKNDRFTSQSQELWFAIKAGLRNILNADSEPRHPSILLLLHSRSAEKTALCLAKSVGGLVSNVDVVPHNRASSFDSHKSLFEALDDGLKSQTGAFVLHDLTGIPGDAAMALHPFSDNENAPHKRAYIIMTLPEDDDQIDDSVSDFERVEKILTKVWGNDHDADRIAPIVSRIAVNVFKINEEAGVSC